jgi:hypothetical protein
MLCIAQCEMKHLIDADPRPRTSEDRTVEFILSARAARCLRTKPERPAGGTDPNAFLCQWRVEAAKDSCGGAWFMATNLVTLFTFLIPRQSAKNFQELAEAFRTRLRFALLAASPPLEWDFARGVPVSGNPRATVGSMNDMCRLLAHPRRPGEAIPFGDLEAYLNHTPFSALGTKGRYEIPVEQWLRKLNALSQRSIRG